MKKIVRMSRVIALLAALALVVAACGSGDDAAVAPTAPPSADEPAPLPPNPDRDSEPLTGAACLEGEPDCNDTGVIGDEPMVLPPPVMVQPRSEDSSSMVSSPSPMPCPQMPLASSPSRDS